MASHILDEVEKVCTHVAIIQKGVMKTYGSVQEVLHPSGVQANKVLIEIGAADTEKLRNVLQGMQGVESVTDAEQDLQILCDESVTAEQVNKYCFEQGVILNKLQVKRKSLETRFLEITGKQSDR